MPNKYTQKAQSVIQHTHAYASELGHSFIGTEHLLLALASEKGAMSERVLLAHSITPTKLRRTIAELCGSGSSGALLSPHDMTPRLRQVLEDAAKEATLAGSPAVGTEHLLLALLCDREAVACGIVEKYGVRLCDLREELLGTSASTAMPKKDKKSAEKGSCVTSFGYDLCAAAREGRLDEVFGREEETEHVIRILSRRQKNNPCLVGEPGVGKTAVVEGLAIRMASGNVPEPLQDKRIVSLDLSAMIAGAKYRGEFEERMKQVLTEAAKDPSLILFIDELHTVVGAGAAEGAVDAANILKPALARGQIRVIGATTTEEYRAHIEKDAALERRFQAVTVAEPNEAATLHILQGLRPAYEKHHSLRISDDALQAAVSLSVRYLPDRRLPDKALDLVDEAAAWCRLQALGKREGEMSEQERLQREKEAAIAKGELERAEQLCLMERELPQAPADRTASCTVMPSDIAAVVTSWTGIPIDLQSRRDTELLLDMESKLSGAVIGQEQAIRTLCAAVRRGRSGWRTPSRPIASFLFLGGSGVGKTELCRALARHLFGTEQALIRLDMSEYTEPHSVSRLIGSPPGYVGYGEGGRLTERVRRSPYSLLLFDEIVKAHRDVYHILLPMLEDGVLTDTAGRRVDFRNTLIVMTANLSPLSQKAPLGFGADTAEGASRRELTEEIKHMFPAELLNRLDEIIRFRTLDKNDMTAIAHKELCELCGRCESLALSLSFTEDVPLWLAERCSNGRYGARALKRAIAKDIEGPLSDAMLKGELSPRETAILSVINGSLHIEKSHTRQSVLPQGLR